MIEFVYLLVIFIKNKIKMGVCSLDPDNSTLVFDCVSYGMHKMTTKKGLKLQHCLKVLSKKIKVPLYKISKASYFFEDLDKHRTIKELNLPSGAVISVKFKSN